MDVVTVQTNEGGDLLWAAMLDRLAGVPVPVEVRRVVKVDRLGDTVTLQTVVLAGI